MNKQSKNHHFVPQSILRNFSINGKGKQIFVYDKEVQKSFTSSIEKAGSENNFNTLQLEYSQINFEDEFNAIDSLTPKVLRKIIESETLSVLNENELLNLITIVLVQFFRTKLQRTSLINFSEQLKDRLSEFEINPDHVEKLKSLNEEDAKLISFNLLSRVKNHIQYFKSKDLLLIKAIEQDTFWISDNPVVLFNVFPYGEVGLNAKGIEIYFPISSTLCIGFYCPSILLKLEELFKDDVNNESENSWLKKVYLGMKNFTVIQAQSSTVDFINELQIRSSSRFLYSTTNNFSLAERVLNLNPQFGNIKSLFSIGKFGEFPSPKSNFPSGEFLVVYSENNHYMLPIKDLSDELDFSGIKFLALDFDKLKIILNDAPFEEFRVYKDGFQMRRMREAIFGELDFSENKPITIKHKNEGLRIIKKG